MTFNNSPKNSSLLYKNTQIGYTLLAFLIPAIAGLGWLYQRSRMDGGPGSIIIAVVLLFICIVTVLFSTLTIEVDREELRHYFTFGFWEKSVPVRAIKDVKTVRNQIFYGWGIRMTFHGPLYNVSGLNAVELDTSTKGIFRIGCNEPTTVKRVIEKAQAESSS